VTATGPGTHALTDPGIIRCEAAEAVLLGAAMLAPHKAAGVLADLTEADFTSGHRAAVFAAIRRLTDRGDPPDPVCVLGELRAAGQLPARNSGHVGVFLIELIQLVPSVANAGYYRRIVFEHAYRRRARLAADRIAQAAPDHPLDTLADLIAAELAAAEAAARRAGIHPSRGKLHPPGGTSQTPSTAADKPVGGPAGGAGRDAA
jgi:replicative DNA helicase